MLKAASDQIYLTEKRIKMFNKGRKTITCIQNAVKNGLIPPEFTPKQVNSALKINYGGTFLPKHRVNNPDNNTELFIRLRKGLYKLNN